jgi:hypothetical protein
MADGGILTGSETRTDERVYGVFTPIASWPAVALFFIACLICNIGFQLRAGVLDHQKTPDERGWYNPGEIRELFERFDERGRNVYATTEMTLDLAFPIAYGGMFAALIGHLFTRHTARIFVAVPLLTVAADLTENSLLSYYAWNFDGKQWPLLIGVATIATAIKFVLFGLSALLVTIGGLRALATGPVH